MAKKKASKITAADRAAVLEYLRKLQHDPGAERKNAEAVLEKYREEILSKHGVIAADVGIKVSGETHTRLYAICIYVKHKTRKRRGKAPRGGRKLAGQIVPTGFSLKDFIPEDYDGVATDVIEGGLFSPVAAGRPLGGDQIKAVGLQPDHPGGPIVSLPGTMGLGVLNKFSKYEKYVTCAHVLTFVPKTETPVITSDRNVVDRQNQIVGTITSERGLNGDWEYNAIVDCAVITPTNARKRTRVPVRETTDQQPRSMAIPHIDLEARGATVWTMGQVTGVRRTGTVINICGTPPFADGTIGADQIMVSPDGGVPFAEPGDSGAVVCVGKTAIGIVRAVNDAGKVAVSPLMTKSKAGIADILGLAIAGSIKP